MKRILAATAIYFGVVFGAGFVLGTARVLLLLPAIGERASELIEAPFMILAIIFSARFVLRRFATPSKLSQRLAIGIGALLLLLAVEFAVVLQLRGLTIEAYLASRDPIAGAVYGVSLLFFALAPACLGSLSRAASEERPA